MQSTHFLARAFTKTHQKHIQYISCTPFVRIHKWIYKLSVATTIGHHQFLNHAEQAITMQGQPPWAKYDNNENMYIMSLSLSINITLLHSTKTHQNNIIHKEFEEKIKKVCVTYIQIYTIRKGKSKRIYNEDIEPCKICGIFELKSFFFSVCLFMFCCCCCGSAFECVSVWALDMTLLVTANAMSNCCREIGTFAFSTNIKQNIRTQHTWTVNESGFCLMAHVM